MRLILSLMMVITRFGFSETTVGRGEMLPASGKAFVLVNGTQLIPCAIPTRSEARCQVEYTAHANLKSLAVDSYGRVELSCVFYSSVDVVSADRPWVGILTVDDEDIALGRLPHSGEPTTIVCRYVRTQPTILRLTIAFQEANSRLPHPEEEQLVAELRLLFLNDRLRRRAGGFAALSHIENCVKDLELYQRVVGYGPTEGYYHRNLAAFLNNHPNSFTSRREPGVETVVALVEPDAAPWDEAAVTAVREQIRARDVVITREIERILENGPVTMDRVLEQLRNFTPYEDQLRASSVTFMRFLHAQSDLFYVHVDPVHTTLVGRRDSA